MKSIEFHASISENGSIVLPPEIRDQMLLKPDQIVKITVEMQEEPDQPVKSYSFEKVRKLLKGVGGEMSSEIVTSRKDRI